MAAIYLKPGREKSVLRRHPWIFSGAIAEEKGDFDTGETVDILDSQGDFLARAAFSPLSQIRARIWSWDPAEEIGPDFFRNRLMAAVEARRLMVDLANTNAYRLVHGESDGLPGLIADRYGDTLVVQFSSSGVERWRDTLIDILQELTGAERIFERSDLDVRELEGLEPRVGFLRDSSPVGVDQVKGSLRYVTRLQIIENGLKYWVDIQTGQKTGFYLDQRENRSYVRLLANGREVLDCFSYTGGFALSSLAGGAKSVTAVESSSDALAVGRKNLTLNNFTEDRVEWIEGDAFQVLRKFRDQGRRFDLVILDPPKFAPTAAQAQRAARGYKDINLLAFKLLRRGGLLVTFSCSGGVGIELFQKIVAGASLDAGVEAQIIERLHQGPDHPVALNFPEGAYLKGLVCYVK